MFSCVNMTSASWNTYDKSRGTFSETSGCSGALYHMEWPMGLVIVNAGFAFAAETEKEGKVPITKVREQETRLQ